MWSYFTLRCLALFCSWAPKSINDCGPCAKYDKGSLRTCIYPGPPRETILVSAAHCAAVCKDESTGQVLETCCCRQEDPQTAESCVGVNNYLLMN